jgi:hypothetical protein
MKKKNLFKKKDDEEEETRRLGQFGPTISVALHRDSP